MSGEFGSYCNGYLHTQMDHAASDLAEGSLASTRVWADLFAELQKVTRGICWAEAGDTAEAQSIITAMDRLPAIKKYLAEIEAFYDPYSEVAKRAVREAIDDHQ